MPFKAGNDVASISSNKAVRENARPQQTKAMTKHTFQSGLSSVRKG